MPVRYTPSGDHHEREEYSFYTRDHGPRDFARSRRFGGDDAEDSRTMSLVSNPLQVPLIGRRRSVSPSERSQRSYNPPPNRYEDQDGDFYEEKRSVQRQRRRPSTENRRRYEYDFNDEVSLEPLVPTYQPRLGRYRHRETSYDLSPSRQVRQRPQERQQPQYEEDYGDYEVIRHKKQQKQEYRQQPEDEDEEPRQQQPTPRQQRQQQDAELESILNWRKRSQEPPLVHTDFGYEIPPMRKRVDPALQDEEDNYRSVVGYIAKRKQFAVEDDDDMQYYRNPNYQYRIHGMERPLVTEKDVEDSMERSKLDRAPMFDMKLRSHVVWEKMNVKFTCTVRGSPTPRVTWYKDMVPLEPSLHSPGKYKISNNFGLHTLEICRASIEDSGTYRVSMQNRKGEISSYATLLVRRYDGGRMGVVDLKSGYNLKKPTDYPDVEGLNIPGKRPHVGQIEVKEYDELPDTDAARHFKSQIENLDFDVKKLIKDAKLDKDIENTDKRLGEIAKNMTSQIIDDATMNLKQEQNGITLDAESKTNELSHNVDGEKQILSAVYDIGDDVTKGSDSDVGSESSQKGRFKVAIEVNVTNETRRDSLDTFEKILEKERKSGAKEEHTESKKKQNTEGEAEPQSETQEITQERAEKNE